MTEDNCVLTYDLRQLADVRLQPALIIEVPGLRGTVVLDFRKRPTTWRRKPKARPTFDIDEINVLSEAAENGRVRPKDFLAWCLRKKCEPYWCLDQEATITSANGKKRRSPRLKGWTIGRLLAQLNAKLRLIKVATTEAKTEQGPYAEENNDATA